MKQIGIIENGMVSDHFKTEKIEITDDGSGGITMKFKIHRPLDWKPSDELDSIPLGTPEEERSRAKQWMDQAAANQRDVDYWRDKRAYPAEECVRLQKAAYDADMQDAWDGGFKGIAMKDVERGGLPAHVLSWPRPENPERFHAVHVLLKNGLTVKAP